jgi:hypothetical protein
MRRDEVNVLESPPRPSPTGPEYAKVYPELVTLGPTGKSESVRYHELIPMLLNELQQQDRQQAELKAQNAALAARLEDWSKRLCEPGLRLGAEGLPKQCCGQALRCGTPVLETGEQISIVHRAVRHLKKRTEPLSATRCTVRTRSAPY